MYRLFSMCVASVLGAGLAAIAPMPCQAQEQYQFESDLIAKGRVFESVGAGFRAIRRGPKGNYYILTAPAPVLQIYDAAGKRVGQVPNESAAKTKGASLVAGESVDLDPQ